MCFYPHAPCDSMGLQMESFFSSSFFSSSFTPHFGCQDNIYVFLIGTETPWEGAWVLR